MNPEIEWFLKVEFQQAFEEADFNFKKEAPEETPYIYKYKQRQILEDLLKNENLTQQITPENINEAENQYLIGCKLLINFHLGANYQDTEEGSQSENYFQKTLFLLSQLTKENVVKFYNVLQEIYNTLGLIYINRDQNELGLSFLGKSLDLYKSMEFGKVPLQNIINNSNNYIDLTQQHFQYYFEGGISLKKTDLLYTHTLFYLAQGYTKVDKKDMAADYCGRTMKRQFESKTFELKDFCVNCMSLADFYTDLKNFQQAEYLLLAAHSILPEGKKKKMRATLEMSLGFILFEYLKTSVDIIEYSRQDEKDYLDITYNRLSLKFEGVDINMKHVKVVTEVDDLKSIFRQANTQFKKAIAYFVIDGFVTEHIQIAEYQSNLYKELARLETDPKKFYGLQERRIELLEPIFRELNEKAFSATWEKLLCQIAEIYNVMMEQKFKEIYQDGKGLAKPKLVLKLNQAADKVIELYSKIYVILSKDKETERNLDFYNSLLAAKFNVAKAYSKVFRNTKKERIDVLIKSLNEYKSIQKYIEDEIPDQVKLQNHELEQQLDMCIEMINMLPSKIDKVNAEQEY